MMTTQRQPFILPHIVLFFLSPHAFALEPAVRTAGMIFFLRALQPMLCAPRVRGSGKKSPAVSGGARGGRELCFAAF